MLHCKWGNTPGILKIISCSLIDKWPLWNQNKYRDVGILATGGSPGFKFFWTKQIISISSKPPFRTSGIDLFIFCNMDPSVENQQTFSRKCMKNERHRSLFLNKTKYTSCYTASSVKSFLARQLCGCRSSWSVAAFYKPPNAEKLRARSCKFTPM